MTGSTFALRAPAERARGPYRVCLFSNLFPPVPSGSSAFTTALGRELARRGHAVDVITARLDPSQPDCEEHDGVTVHRLTAWRLPPSALYLGFRWMNFVGSPANLRRIDTIVAACRPDVIHVQNHMFDLAWIASRLCRRRRIPLVVTLHTILRHPIAAYNIVLSPLDRALKHLVVGRADAVIGPDLNMCAYARRVFDRDAVMVPYGIAVPDADAAIVECVRQRHALHDKRVILSLGHVHRKRNRLELIAAMPRIRQSHPSAVLLIVGAVAIDDPARLAAQLGVADAVMFAGAIPHHEIAAYLRAADLEVHWLDEGPTARPSLGIASLEAMAAGTPMVTTAASSCYEAGVLGDGVNFVSLPDITADGIAATIISLLADDDRRRCIGAAGRETIREYFGWDQVCAHTVAVYASAIERGSSGRQSG